MKNYRIAGVILAAALIAACTPKARISGTLEGAPSDKVIVKLLDVNTYVVLDTLKTDAAGKYSCKVDIKKGQPEFIYLYHGDTKIASLLLEAGDQVNVTSDTKGNYTVEGSPESEKLQEVEESYANFLSTVSSMTETSSIARAYINYYRQCLKYITQNPHSLTVIPVMYQTFEGETPIFSQQTDAIRYRNVADTLLTVYPDSKYVQALSREAENRLKLMDIYNRVDSAQELAFPDLNLPGMDGQRVSLASLDNKVIFLYFWTSQHSQQTLFNLEFLGPIYDDYKSKGLEIYAVCLDTDKSLWASIVRNQNLKWINVNDGLGAASPAVQAYNITTIPTLYIIENGELVTRQITTERELRRYLDGVLK